MGQDFYRVVIAPTAAALEELLNEYYSQGYEVDIQLNYGDAFQFGVIMRRKESSYQ